MIIPCRQAVFGALSHKTDKNLQILDVDAGSRIRPLASHRWEVSLLRQQDTAQLTVSP
jgi:hypothetical protein